MYTATSYIYVSPCAILLVWILSPTNEDNGVSQPHSLEYLEGLNMTNQHGSLEHSVQVPLSGCLTRAASSNYTA